MSTASDAAQGFINVVADPCLPTVGGLLFELHKLESDPNAPSEPVTASLGIGLCKIVKPLQGVVYLRKNPIVAVAGIAAFLGIFVGIGYKMGNRRTLGKLGSLGDPWHDYFAKGADDARGNQRREPDNKFRHAYRAGHNYVTSRTPGKKVIDV